MTDNKRLCKASAYVAQMAVYILLLPFSGIVFYRRNRRNWQICQRFCYAMCSHMVFRELYSILFACGIAAVHLINMRLTHELAYSALTLAVSVPLLFHRIGHPLLTAIRSNRQLQLLLIVLSVAALFTPHLLSFGVGLYLLFVAAIFYPSREALQKFQTFAGIRFYRQCPDKLVKMYFN